MTKDISTLVDDIYSVVEGTGGWDKVIHDFYMDNVGATMWSRLSDHKKTHKPSLRMSNIGTECERRLWFDLNTEGTGDMPSHLHLRFLMGDLTEELLLSLAMAAGHEVTGQQDTIKVDGIKGHRDAVIDGVNVDVKSTSASNFNKFKNHTLALDDPYGYVKQLQMYVYGSAEDDKVTDKVGGAFLAMNINTGELALDYHNFSEQLPYTSNFVKKMKGVVAQPSPPPRPYVDDEQKNGNHKLNKKCTFCPHKKACVPSLRSFEYSGFTQHFTYLESVPHGKKEIEYD